jgi:NAD(P)-dependent dehydrogenase (short-subunit alcohol dehydrogenase family)
MCPAFAPVLAANGGGAVVNILSVVSWITVPVSGSYCVSKAAELAMTNGIRVELRAQDTLVVGVHAGYIDTDMTASLEIKKPSLRPLFPRRSNAARPRSWQTIGVGT